MDAVRLTVNEVADAVVFFGFILLLGTFLATLRWMYARKSLHPAPPKEGAKQPAELTAERRAWFEREEIEAGDAMVGLPFLAVVCFAVAACMRFWPW